MFAGAVRGRLGKKGEILMTQSSAETELAVTGAGAAITPSTAQLARRGSRFAVIALALLVDAACVLAFSAAGRSQHGEASTLAGLWHTAWPFLVALVCTWAVSLAWRHPLAVLRSGLPIWLGTLVLGLVVRVAFTDGGAPLAFVLVATGTLFILFVGWRGIFALFSRMYRRA